MLGDASPTSPSSTPKLLAVQLRELSREIEEAYAAVAIEAEKSLRNALGIPLDVERGTVDDPFGVSASTVTTATATPGGGMSVTDPPPLRRQWPLRDEFRATAGEWEADAEHVRRALRLVAAQSAGSFPVAAVPPLTSSRRSRAGGPATTATASSTIARRSSQSPSSGDEVGTAKGPNRPRSPSSPTRAPPDGADFPRATPQASDEHTGLLRRLAWALAVHEALRADVGERLDQAKGAGAATAPTAREREERSILEAALRAGGTDAARLLASRHAQSGDTSRRVLAEQLLAGGQGLPFPLLSAVGGSGPQTNKASLMGPAKELKLRRAMGDAAVDLCMGAVVGPQLMSMVSAFGSPVADAAPIEAAALLSAREQQRLAAWERQALSDGIRTALAAEVAGGGLGVRPEILGPLLEPASAGAARWVLPTPVCVSTGTQTQSTVTMGLAHHAPLPEAERTFTNLTAAAGRVLQDPAGSSGGVDPKQARTKASMRAVASGGVACFVLPFSTSDPLDLLLASSRDELSRRTPQFTGREMSSFEARGAGRLGAGDKLVTSTQRQIYSSVGVERGVLTVDYAAGAVHVRLSTQPVSTTIPFADISEVVLGHSVAFLPTLAAAKDASRKSHTAGTRSSPAVQRALREGGAGHASSTSGTSPQRSGRPAAAAGPDQALRDAFALVTADDAAMAPADSLDGLFERFYRCLTLVYAPAGAQQRTFIAGQLGRQYSSREWLLRHPGVLPSDDTVLREECVAVIVDSRAEWNAVLTALMHTPAVGRRLPVRFASRFDLSGLLAVAGRQPDGLVAPKDPSAMAGLGAIEAAAFGASAAADATRRLLESMRPEEIELCERAHIAPLTYARVKRRLLSPQSSPIQPYESLTDVCDLDTYRLHEILALFDALGWVRLHTLFRVV